MEKVIILVGIFVIIVMSLLGYAMYRRDVWKLYDAEQKDSKIKFNA